MKNLIYALTIIILSTISLFAQNETLRGDAAIEKLKQTGQYDSLMEAVRSARQKNNQTEEPNTEDAIGQMTRLNASDGEAEDQFGFSVAISGDTAIVGAVFDDVGANFDQGSAYVFVKSGTVWTQQAQLTASDGAIGDQFGNSVTISGDTAIVGANFDEIGANFAQGSAYVFVRSGTVWTQQQKLTASDGATNDFFGWSVAISGETAIIGAYSDNIGANSNQGSAYVFVRSGVTWTQQQKLTASDGAANDVFGFSVSISGDTAIINATADDVGANTDQGSAYVFTRSGVTWTEQQQLTASDGTAFDNFGISVSISGDTVVIGAQVDDVGANSNQGSAYVFVKSGITWTQQQKLNSSDGAANDNFGWSVSISGDTVIVGAITNDVGANLDQGSAYIFTRSGVTWTQQQKLNASDGTINDYFGGSVAISGNNIFVGVNFDKVGANVNQGSAYAFRVLGNGWTQEAQRVLSDGALNDYFGRSVAISGDTAIVGAYLDDVGANTDQGSAYIFVRSGTTWTQQAQLTASDGLAFDYFAFHVAIYGDTAIVGAILDTVGGNAQQGSAYVFTRSGTIWTEQQKLTATDGAAGDFFGISVAISGNTAIIGASNDDVGANNDQGSAYVFTRSGTVWTQQAQLTASDGATLDTFGVSVSISGNTAIVGANQDNVGANTDQGSAYIFTRSGITWTQQAQLTATGGAANDTFGISVAISGDTALVGAYQDDVGANTNQGSAYVFTRSGGVWTQQAQLNGTGGAATDNFGSSVSLDGDTAVVGAYQDDVGANANQGSAYVFYRVGTVWTQQALLTATGGTANDQFGISVAISGDKIIVGAPTSDATTSVPFAPQATDQGAAFMFINNLIPTAAGVSVAGRILSANGNGVRNAIVSATLANGEVITTRSSAFGYYRFDDLEAGQTIVISVNSKRFAFTSQVVTLNESIGELDFTANP